MLKMLDSTLFCWLPCGKVLRSVIKIKEDLNIFLLQNTSVSKLLTSKTTYASYKNLWYQYIKNKKTWIEKITIV